ncbi:hypothetical protein Kfla_3572 [Kribbella flavida DSM 17836]|uniref:Uncharacterized protein n=1 Tax=Kribbella flavida (strain DSM 17836 / JCM 10339 / NBRC 14399) TaxID=479435 RepID=D2PMS7_KRIFD|nr:hypothetical protein Kfla_3572 [Kribbella flavida DSM 17836]
MNFSASRQLPVPVGRPAPGRVVVTIGEQGFRPAPPTPTLASHGGRPPSCAWGEKPMGAG